MKREKPKDIAKKMVSDFMHLAHQGGEIEKTVGEREFENSKDCALISVGYLTAETGAKHWYKVKAEVLKLNYEDFKS